MAKAGLNINKYQAIPAEELFRNLKAVWDRLGRQPTIKEINSGISVYSVSAYTRKFGTWLNALKEFIKFVEEGKSKKAKVKRQK